MSEEPLSSGSLCQKSVKCSKNNCHRGKCDSRRHPKTEFWKYSRKWLVKEKEKELRTSLSHEYDDIRKRKLDQLEREETLAQMEAEIKKLAHEVDEYSTSIIAEAQGKADDLLSNTEKICEEKEHIANEHASQIMLSADNLKTKLDDSTEKLSELSCQLTEKQNEYDKLKVVIEKKLGSRTKRSSNSTSFDMVSDPKSSTRYRRRAESKETMNFIHGGEEGALYGAWDLVVSLGTSRQVEELISGYKKGKFLQGHFNSLTKKFETSDVALKQALVLKYNNYLSTRKYRFQCRTLNSLFDPDKQTWIPRNSKVNDMDISMPKLVSMNKLDSLAKSIDIGHVNVIPGGIGVCRTLVSLVIMITDIHLRLPYLAKRLIWFNERTNHFIFQFGDDGAPETGSLTMSIGTLTCWNFGVYLRSREFQYALHGLSLPEKHALMVDIWNQHTQEMLLLEGSVFTINGQLCSFEFQPSADQSWQTWAANEVTQAATYPSPYANVSKFTMSVPHGKIGTTWQATTSVTRDKHVKMVDTFAAELEHSTCNLSDKARHDRILEFLAANGCRTLGPPRIGTYANRLRPEPLHCEINSWQDFLDLVYHEALVRDKFEAFASVLQSAVKQRVNAGQATVNVESAGSTVGSEGAGARVKNIDCARLHNSDFVAHLQANWHVSSPVETVNAVPGLGLAFITKFVREHYQNSKTRYNKLPVRLIGEQAIKLAHYSHRLVDCLFTENETDEQRLVRLALGKIGQMLRDACSIFNRINMNNSDLVSLQDALSNYYNLHVLFFAPRVNLSIWTMGCAIPYYVEELYKEHKIGYGIVSCQSKEAKHASIKKDLALSNRHSSEIANDNKWWQVFRAEYIRCFYIPEFCPQPSLYHSHYCPRVPKHCSTEEICNCGRNLQEGSTECQICLQSKIIMDCAINGKLSDSVSKILLPNACEQCSSRFSDRGSLETHVKSCHMTSFSVLTSDPRSMGKAALIEVLNERGLDTRGRVAILRQRLLGALEGED